MIYRQFKDKELSLLGFGAMRLPTVEREGKRAVDVELTERMIDRAIEAGVNYFDTAYPYHAGESEVVVGKILSKYPRESYYLADKFPGHQLRESYDPKEVFEDQLKRCGVDYFDFYLLHDVNENSVSTYTDERWGIIEYFKEQRRLGRIKHLGFSSHAMLPALKDFLDAYGEDMEFCQIQFNYLDDTLQKAGEKYEEIISHGIPVWVMEPVRGGKLANLADEYREMLASHRQRATAASFGFRWLFDYEGVGMILSGMSNMEQVEDNIATFGTDDRLTDAERRTLGVIRDSMTDILPCTACGYCMDACPLALPIPMLLSTYSEMKYQPAVNVARRIEFIEEEKHPRSCIGCGRCEKICPQKIEIPKILRELCNMAETAPSWTQICREREEEEKRMKAKRTI